MSAARDSRGAGGRERGAVMIVLMLVITLTLSVFFFQGFGAGRLGDVNQAAQHAADAAALAGVVDLRRPEYGEYVSGALQISEITTPTVARQAARDMAAINFVCAASWSDFQPNLDTNPSNLVDGDIQLLRIHSATEPDSVHVRVRRNGANGNWVYNFFGASLTVFGAGQATGRVATTIGAGHQWDNGGPTVLRSSSCFPLLIVAPTSASLQTALAAGMLVDPDVDRAQGGTPQVYFTRLTGGTNGDVLNGMSFLCFAAGQASWRVGGPGAPPPSLSVGDQVNVEPFVPAFRNRLETGRTLIVPVAVGSPVPPGSIPTGSQMATIAGFLRVQVTSVGGGSPPVPVALTFVPSACARNAVADAALLGDIEPGLYRTAGVSESGPRALGIVLAPALCSPYSYPGGYVTNPGWVPGDPYY